MKAVFLQGPLGPFFRYLMDALREQQVSVSKINFNGGDEWYSDQLDAISYRGDTESWPEFFESYVRSNDISAVFVYGEGRIYHRLAKDVARKLNIDFYVFEEGYLRPNQLTLEKGGVNANSAMNLSQLAHWQDTEVDREEVIGNHLWSRVRFAASYYNMAFIRRRGFPYYQHHRSFSPVYEAFCWLRAGFRRYKYQLTERKVAPFLVASHSKEFFLFPLQVCSDAQIKFHSPFASIEESIDQVMHSFSKHAEPNHLLVIKHHPMDRGHNNYRSLIKQLAVKYGLGSRVIYCHDQHLPTLLDHSLGVVTINSTTALSAFYHKAPVKVLGDAFYDISGLCNQNSLDDFWKTPGEVDSELFAKFRNYLTRHGQINASFYNKWSFSIAQVADQIVKALTPKA